MRNWPLLLLTVGTLVAAQSQGLQTTSLHYVGGGVQTSARAFAVDPPGNIFTVLNFTSASGVAYIRVIKSSSTGSVLDSFDFGGSGNNVPEAAAIDPFGNIIIVGSTTSPDFPSVAPLVSAPAGQAAFINKIDTNLTKILFSMRLGGSGMRPATIANAVALDTSGNVYVTGVTSAADFPVTSGAYQTQPPATDAFGSASYAFVTKLSPDETKILYSTFFGANTASCSGGSACVGVFGQTSGAGIAVDPQGDAIITGATTASNLPITSGAPSQTCTCTYQNSAGFIAKLSGDGSQLLWSTYVSLPALVTLVLQSAISPDAIALDSSGDVIIAGTAPQGFPTTAGAVEANFPGTGAAYFLSGFVAKYSSSGRQVLFATYMGGNVLGTPNGVDGIAVDPQGIIWLTGGSIPSELPFPGGATPLGPTYAAALSADGTNLLGAVTAPIGAAGVGLGLLPKGGVIALGQNGSLLDISLGSGPALVGIASSAGFEVSGLVAPYEEISLYGLGIGPATPANGQVVNGVLGVSAGGVQVAFDGIPAPILYAGPNQINAIVPAGVAGRATTQIQITSPGGAIQGPTLVPSLSQPRVYSAYESILGYLDGAIALNQDGSVNSRSNPAAAGSIVTIWATGAGLAAFHEADGAIAGSAPGAVLDYPALPVSIIRAVAPADSLEVTYAGDAPGFVAGTMQVNFRLPEKSPVISAPGLSVLSCELEVGSEYSETFGVYMQPPL